MRNALVLIAAGSAVALAPRAARADLLVNGNLDRVHAVEIVPGFFLPKPDGWVNLGTKTVTGPYEDEMSSEPWAGPGPTPVTLDGFANPAPYNSSGDWGVFFKAYTGNSTTGDFATGHLYQDVPGTPGNQYTLTGWAGAEANFLGSARFALDFLNAGGGMISSAELDLNAAGLFTDNGEPFDYKQYSVKATAPAGTAFVRARASFLNGSANQAGGGQAFVVDDFTLVPAPATLSLMALLGAPVLSRARRQRRAGSTS